MHQDQFAHEKHFTSPVSMSYVMTSRLSVLGLRDRFIIERLHQVLSQRDMRPLPAHFVNGE